MAGRRTMRRILLGVLLLMHVPESASISKDDIPADMLPEGISLDDIPADFDFSNIPADMLPDGVNPGDIPADFDINNIPPELLPDGISPEDIPPGFDMNNIPAGMLPEGISPEDIPPSFRDGAAAVPKKEEKATESHAQPTTPIPVVKEGLIVPSMFFNVSGHIGDTVVLNCTKSRGSRGPIMWLHAADGSPVSRDREVTQSMRHRMEIIGDAKKNEYHLVVKYLRFPMDEGKWTCVSFDGMTQHSTLTVLVPPPSPEPHVTPDNISVLDPYSDAWTFTCTAHFAHPPVELTWKKISGQDQEYDVTPPSYIRSPDGTQAVTSKLIVTARNFGSVFSCTGSHPAYMGRTYSQNALFLPPRALEAVGFLKARAKSLIPRLSLGSSDYAMVAVILLVAFLVFITGACLFTSKRKWELDVRFPMDYWQFGHKADIGSNGSISKESIKSAKDTSTGKAHSRMKHAERRKCVSQVVCGALLSGLLLFAVLFAVPLYMKGVSIPVLSTHELTSVVAGSALWLDCSALVHPVGSLLQVTWRKNADQIYKQYMVNKQHMGYPYNSSVGLSVGTRVSSNKLGQISIWPMRGGEEGVYSCEVAGIMDDTGRTKLKIKTFGVFVVTGMIINYPLLGVLGLCFLCTVGIITIGICHSCKCVRHRQSILLTRAATTHDSHTPTDDDDGACAAADNGAVMTKEAEQNGELLPNNSKTESQNTDHVYKSVDTQTLNSVNDRASRNMQTFNGGRDVQLVMDTWSSEEDMKGGEQHKVYVQVDCEDHDSDNEEEGEEDTYLLPVDVVRPKLEEPDNNNEAESTKL